MALGDLLLAIHAPELTGAACKGRPEVFDAQPPKTADRGYLHTRAKWICLRKCPALAQCRAWLESLPPSQRPEGWWPVSSSSRRFGDPTAPDAARNHP